MNNNQETVKKIALMFLGAALFTAVIVGINRVVLEVQNIKVETVMGYSDIKKLVSYSEKSYAEVFEQLKNAGITSVAIEEDTLLNLQQKGEISWYTGEEILRMGRMGQIRNDILARNTGRNSIKLGYHYILFDDVDTYNRARDSFFEELGPAAVREIGGYILELRRDIEDLGSIGLGVSIPIARIVRNYGFNVIPRMVNSTRLQEEALTRKIAKAKEIEGVNTIIFSGNEVLGFRNNSSLIVNLMKANNLNFGFIEFANQKGSAFLAQSIPEQTIGVHSISEYSLKRMNSEKAIARYVRAVSERGMRILYIHPLFNIAPQKNLFEYNIEYIQKLKKTLESRHFQIQVITDPIYKNLFFGSNTFFALFLSLGVAASILLFLQFFTNISKSFCYSTLLLFLLITIAAFFLEKMPLWRSVLALLVTLIYPVYALISNVPAVIQDSADDPLRWKKGVALLLKMLSVIGIGVLLIIGLLSDPRYMLKIYQFSGVKLAYIVPVLFIFWYYVVYPDKARALRFIVRRYLQIPISLGVVLLAAAGAGALLLYVGRSGNFSFPIFYGEDTVRDILNTVFFVRPRTKEFLIGYPVFLLFISYFETSFVKKWKWLFMVLTVIGLVSLLNTFCHIHAPLFLSVFRSFNGFVLGIAFGFLYIIFIQGAQKVWKFLAY